MLSPTSSATLRANSLSDRAASGGVCQIRKVSEEDGAVPHWRAGGVGEYTVIGGVHVHRWTEERTCCH